MTRIAKPFAKLLLPTAAVLSVLGMAATTSANAPAKHPVSCGFAVEEGRFGQTLKGTITANEDISGRFKMTFTKTGANRANVSQSGSFALDAGDSRTLGQMSFGGGGQVDAQLTLHVNETTLVCASDGVIDL